MQQAVQAFSVLSISLDQQGVQVDAVPTTAGTGRFNTTLGFNKQVNASIVDPGFITSVAGSSPLTGQPYGGAGGQLRPCWRVSRGSVTRGVKERTSLQILPRLRPADWALRRE